MILSVLTRLHVMRQRQESIISFDHHMCPAACRLTWFAHACVSFDVVAARQP